MISVGNMKSAQLRKLFRILQSSIIENLEIFGAMEGICFEFAGLNQFWKFWENSNHVGPACQWRYPNVGAQTTRQRPNLGATAVTPPTIPAVVVSPASTTSRGYIGRAQGRGLLPFCLVASLSHSAPHPCLCSAPPHAMPTPITAPHHQSFACEHHLSVARVAKHHQLPP
jgi:hypothetical protein